MAGSTTPASARSPRCANTGIIAGRCGRRAAVVSPNTIGCTLREHRGERDAERDQQERRRPRVLAHGGGEDQELAREHAEWRHAEDRERAEREAPADGPGSP